MEAGNGLNALENIDKMRADFVILALTGGFT
jgi:ActR/RegA family two-component response regulator